MIIYFESSIIFSGFCLGCITAEAAIKGIINNSTNSVILHTKQICENILKNSFIYYYSSKRCLKNNSFNE